MVKEDSQTQKDKIKDFKSDKNATELTSFFVTLKSAT